MGIPTSQGFTARMYEKNTVISLFQNLECSIFFKKQQFWIRRNFVSASISLQKPFVNFWYHFHAPE
ncbi:hypothetical protein LEP1GSC108_1021 [Leptospira weilii str. UI 13098]|uniref:Uncharacterized protein n=1 Tax=Leptospira weilii str. UI 13098 TaxID=1088542 RepID=M6QQQ6_9LEPT|nr:hypothetical protein LEP1GSC108_1021 [Leptospira weilii str. UI 13098]